VQSFAPGERVCVLPSFGIGDYVLIPAASSSVGLAAIQLANWAVALPIALTRHSAKAAALRVKGAQHVIATAESDVVAEVMRDVPPQPDCRSAPLPRVQPASRKDHRDGVNTSVCFAESTSIRGVTAADRNETVETEDYAIAQPGAM
jgi:hypothetical protein